MKFNNLKIEGDQFKDLSIDRVLKEESLSNTDSVNLAYTAKNYQKKVIGKIEKSYQEKPTKEIKKVTYEKERVDLDLLLTGNMKKLYDFFLMLENKAEDKNRIKIENDIIREKLGFSRLELSSAYQSLRRKSFVEDFTTRSQSSFGWKVFKLNIPL